MSSFLPYSIGHTGPVLIHWEEITQGHEFQEARNGCVGAGESVRGISNSDLN